MTKVSETMPGLGRYCAHCGHAVGADAPTIQRFGERFCSEAHAEEFTAGVRAAHWPAQRTARGCSLLAGAGAWQPECRRGKPQAKGPSELIGQAEQT